MSYSVNYQLCYAGGDPHFQTLDGLDYTFNGYGKFIYSRANDNSYEVQVFCDVMNNINGSSTISGTIFTSFAMKTNDSSIFQIDIADSSSSNPYLMLKVDGIIVNDFSRNFQYSKDYQCTDNSNSTCTTVIQKDGAHFIFKNGLLLSLKLSKVVIAGQTLSWLTCNMVFSDNSLKNRISGLMGNNNGDKSDDLVSRTDSSISANISVERSIYEIASTCKYTNLI